MKIPRWLSWLVAEDPAPQEFHRWDQAPAREFPIAAAVVVGEPEPLRYGFTTSGEDEGDVRTRCTACGTWYWVSEGHQCPASAFLNAAFPDHGRVLSGDEAEGLIDHYALMDAFNGAAPLMAHSETIRARRLAEIEAGLRGVA